MADTSFAVTSGSGTSLHTATTSIGGTTVHDQVVKVGEPYLATYTIRAASVSTATLDSHLLQVMAGSTLNVYIHRVQVWQQVLATTAALLIFDLNRLTTAGTGGGSITPSLLDSTDAASGTTAMTLPTAKGTEGSLIQGQVGYVLQTVAATNQPTQALIADWQFGNGRTKVLRIAAGTSNGICVKNRTAVAGAQVMIAVTLTEANH